MATTTNVNERIESGLHAILAETRDLPDLLAAWDALPDWNQASVKIDWDHLMIDYLTELDEFACAGQMTPEQQTRYAEVRGALHDALPIIERLGLERPPVA